MAKRKTEEDYHNLAKSCGFKWIGNVLPRNSHIKTWWKCEKGHRWKAKYHSIQQKNGCPYCSNHVKKTEEDYHNLAKSCGFKWIDKCLPKNIVTKTWWECEKGHKWKATYDSVTNCPYCSGKAKKTKQDYHNLAKSRGFKWIDNKLPKNIMTKTWWECEKGHRWKATYGNIYSGRGCPYCSGKIKKTKQDYINLAKSRGFKWIDNKLPKNIMTKTWWECEKEHRWKATYGNIYSGYGCPYCSGKAKKTEKDYHKLAESRGFKWIGVELPLNVLTKTLWECEKGHKWKAIYSNIQQGGGCPFCKNMINGVIVSKPQIKLNNLLCGSLNYPEGKYYIDVAVMRRSQKIAVEYDCWYWHNGREEHDAKRDKFLISRDWKVLHVKSGKLLPTRKQLSIAIDYLLETNNCIYNLYLEDWKKSK